MSDTHIFEDQSIAPLLAMLRAKNNKARPVARKVIHLDEAFDSRRPIAPHLIFAYELFAAYPGIITHKDFDFRTQLGCLAQFSLSQAEMMQALKGGSLTVISDQGNEICFPVEEMDITQLVTDCINIRELANSILPGEQIAVRLRRDGMSIKDVRQVLDQAELCRELLKRTVVSIIEAIQKSGRDLLSPLETEALMPHAERLAITREVRAELGHVNM